MNYEVIYTGFPVIYSLANSSQNLLQESQSSLG